MATQAINPVRMYFEPFAPTAEKDFQVASPARKAVLEFCKETLIGSLLFMLLAIPCILLDSSASYMGGLGLGTAILNLASYVIAAADIFLFVLFLVRSLIRLLRVL